jgi:cobalamin synthase
LAESIQIVAGKLPDKAAEIYILKSASIGAGGVAWFVAVYVGPLVSLVRSPFQRRANIALGTAYLVVVLVLCWVSAQTVQVEAAATADGPGLIFSILRELVQPLRW